MISKIVSLLALFLLYASCSSHLHIIKGQALTVENTKDLKKITFDHYQHAYYPNRPELTGLKSFSFLLLEFDIASAFTGLSLKEGLYFSSKYKQILATQFYEMLEREFKKNEGFPAKYVSHSELKKSSFYHQLGSEAKNFINPKEKDAEGSEAIRWLKKGKWVESHTLIMPVGFRDISRLSMSAQTLLAAHEKTFHYVYEINDLMRDMAIELFWNVHIQVDFYQEQGQKLMAKVVVDLSSHLPWYYYRDWHLTSRGQIPTKASSYTYSQHQLKLDIPIKEEVSELIKPEIFEPIIHHLWEQLSRSLYQVVHHVL